MDPSSCMEPSASVSSEKYVEHSSTSTSRQNCDKPGILKTTIQEMSGNTEGDEDKGWTTKCSKKKKRGAKVKIEDLQLVECPQKKVRKALQEQGGRSSPENIVSYRKVFRNAAEMRGLAQGKKKKELTDEQKHGSLGDPGDESLRLNPSGQARQCWFKSAKSCGVIRTCSPTCGHCARNPAQLRSGVETSHFGAGSGEVSAGHKDPTGLPNQNHGLRQESAGTRGLRPGDGLRPGSVETTWLRPGVQDDRRKTEPTGHGNPVTGSTIAFAKAVTSARNLFSPLRTLDTEGTVDAGEWRPGAG